MFDYGFILDAMLQIIDFEKDERNFVTAQKSKGLEFDTVISKTAKRML